MQCYVAVNFKQNTSKTSEMNEVLELLNWWKLCRLFIQSV